MLLLMLNLTKFGQSLKILILLIKLNMKSSLNLILIFLIFSCKTPKISRNSLLVCGNYTTCKLKKVEKLKYNLKYKSNFFHFYKLGLNLKNDSTFYIIFCNTKVTAIGNWHTNNDTLYLQNILRLKDKKHLADMKHCIKDSLIFFNNGVNIQNQKRHGNITLLKIGGENFDGLTNDSVINIKDSLLSY